MVFDRVTNSDVESVQPTAQYEPPTQVRNKKFGVHQSVIPGKLLSSEQFTNKVVENLPQKVPLEAYKLDPMLEKILSHGMYSSILILYIDKL